MRRLITAISLLAVFLASSLGPASAAGTAITPAFLTAVPPSQSGVTITSAVLVSSLFPPGATMAVITIIGTNNASNICAIGRDDGTAPTTTAGSYYWPVGTIVYYKVNSTPLQIIQASGATCKFSAAFYS